MIYVFTIACIIYGGLMITAGIVEFLQKQRKLSIQATLLTITGGALVLVSAILNYTSKDSVIYILVLGLVIIHFTSIRNGIELYGKINYKHHIIRLAVSLLILGMFFA